jgi:hypothetical protein
MFVIVNKAGQLGNRLFLFSHFIACAIENNFTVVNPTFDEYASFFKTTSKDIFCRYPQSKSLLYQSKLARKVCFKLTQNLINHLTKNKIDNSYLRLIKLEDPNVELDFGRQIFCLDNPSFLKTINSKQITFVHGWLFRDYSNLGKHADKVRNFFEPLDIFQNNVIKLVEKIRKESDILIGVHIRQEDYKFFLNGRYFYSIEEYMEIMKKVENIFYNKSVAFLICSNSKQSEKDFSEFNSFFGTGHLIEDLYSFAQCDYIIGPPSTYTMWASFYGKVPLYRIFDTAKTPKIDDFIVFDGYKLKVGEIGWDLEKLDHPVTISKHPAIL